MEWLRRLPQRNSGASGFFLRHPHLGRSHFWAGISYLKSAVSIGWKTLLMAHSCSPLCGGGWRIWRCWATIHLLPGTFTSLPPRPLKMRAPPRRAGLCCPSLEALGCVAALGPGKADESPDLWLAAPPPCWPGVFSHVYLPCKSDLFLSGGFCFQQAPVKEGWEELVTSRGSADAPWLFVSLGDTSPPLSFWVGS